MIEKEYLQIASKLENYQFTSLRYSDYEELQNFKIIKEDENLIVLLGFDEEVKKQRYHYAANDADTLLSELKEKEVLITFVPKEWEPKFLKAGFVEHAIWNDYFKNNLEDVAAYEDGEMATEADCGEAAEVTQACRYESRGFTGQTEGFMRGWITGKEESAVASETKYNQIFIHRNEEHKIDGIVCTGLYGFESKKGTVSWIREVAVRPESQNKGIARKLISQALKYGKEHGAVRAFLAADECNKHAIHLYESLGFRCEPDEYQLDMIREG